MGQSQVGATFHPSIMATILSILLYCRVNEDLTQWYGTPLR